mmetsp:Transcript_12389/g.55876  ORF Transcript_12389/g.55876 Transcript_12389/m.55876 type:complete len:311 (-) Transcript_12389:448-1380(-)
MDPPHLVFPVLLGRRLDAVQVTIPEHEVHFLPKLLRGELEPGGEIVRSEARLARRLAQRDDLILDDGGHEELAPAHAEAVAVLAVLAYVSIVGTAFSVGGEKTTRRESQSRVFRRRLRPHVVQLCPHVVDRDDRRRDALLHHVILHPRENLADPALRPGVLDILIRPPFSSREPPVQLDAEVGLEHRAALTAVLVHGPRERRGNLLDVARVEVVLLARGAVHARDKVRRGSEPRQVVDRRLFPFSFAVQERLPLATQPRGDQGLDLVRHLLRAVVALGEVEQRGGRDPDGPSAGARVQHRAPVGSRLHRP